MQPELYLRVELWFIDAEWLEGRNREVVIWKTTVTISRYTNCLLMDANAGGQKWDQELAVRLAMNYLPTRELLRTEKRQEEWRNLAGTALTKSSW